MTPLDELHAALLKADAAGDTQSAKLLADHIRALPQQQASPTDSHGIGGLLNFVAQQPVDAANAFGHHAGNLLHGAAQLVENGLAKGANWIAPGSGAAKALQGIANQDNAAMAQREKDYQANTPDSPGAYLGATMGELAPALLTGGGGAAAKAISATPKATALATALNAAKTVGKGAAIGAGYGAAAPVNTPDDFWNTKAWQAGTGAALGGGLGGLANLAGGVWNTVKPAIMPGSTVGDTILGGVNKIMGKGAAGAAQGPEAGNVGGLLGSSTPQQVLDRIAGRQQFVPGSLPTTAQVAGVPELVQAEKALINNPAYSGPFTDRAIANNGARMAVVRGVAQTPEALGAALADRANTTRPLYDAAGAATLPVDDALTALMQRPSMSSAMARGTKLAAERGEAIAPTAATQAVQPGQQVSSIVDANGNPFASATAGAEAQPATISGKAVQYMKMGLDALQSEGRTQGISSHEANALQGTHDALHDWIMQNSPDYATANHLYAQKSVPVNTMQTGQSLADALTVGRTENAAGDQSPTLSIYRTQLAKALKDAKYGIDPEAEAALTGVQSDLARATRSNSNVRPGSDTFFNVQAPNWLSGKLFGENMDGKSSALSQGVAGVLGALGGGPSTGAATVYGMNKLGGFVGNRINSQFQNAMLNPDYFSQLLGEALARQNAIPSAAAGIGPGVSGIGGGNIINSLGPNN